MSHILLFKILAMFCVSEAVPSEDLGLLLYEAVPLGVPDFVKAPRSIFSR